ncbi:unnamed protein product [Rotaria sp. Silwood2]|nr:unnamed protein product [Rotaria sp. Silwood2]CAF4428824.1 unnamed protein product [Rotaria sp. Silwood2]
MNDYNSWWQSAKDVKAKLVPIIPTGWDARPRYENPVPWLYEGPEHYFQPTGEELQQFFRTAINFTCQYNETVEAQTTLVYAWNENSENGACLIPTLGNGTFYVDTLSKILPLYC